MNKIDELYQIIDLRKKHNLPISPILEYAIQERENQYKEEEGISIVNEPEKSIYTKEFDSYIKDIANLSVGYTSGKKLPHKAILLLSIIRQIESGEMERNEISLDNATSRLFIELWNEFIPNIKSPSVWIPFWYMKTEPFWHFKSTNDEQLLTGLLYFGGHPSIGQMRSIIKYAYLDNEFFIMLKDKHNRNLTKEILINTYIRPFTK